MSADHNLFPPPRLVASGGIVTPMAPADWDSAIAAERARLRAIRESIVTRLQADGALLVRCDRALSFLATGGEA